MLKTEIIEFGRLLRKGGVKVSVDQISTALEAVALVGFAYEDFYMALFTILITDQMDRPLFDKLFRLYFYRCPQMRRIPNPHNNAIPKLNIEPARTYSVLECS